MITPGAIQRTPWYYRLFGAPPFRRWIVYSVSEGPLWHEDDAYWQYLTSDAAMRQHDAPGFGSALSPSEENENREGVNASP